MSELNRQQICAALGVSESTIRRLEHIGATIYARWVKVKAVRPTGMQNVG
jgi:hypothetical protein